MCIRDRSKATWEIIDLDERVNFPLYYPVEPQIGSDRRSLFDVLISNVKNGNIDIYDDDYFIDKTSLSESTSFKYIDEEAYKAELDQTGIDDPTLIDTYTLESADIEQWKIRGLWYIDKRLGELKYRIIAICPVGIEARAQALGNNDKPVDLFWVYYPDAREVLHQAKVFNKENTSRPISFDHLLHSRRFSSVIYKEENVYGDREVNDYISEGAFMQLLESDRIKEKIRNNLSKLCKLDRNKINIKAKTTDRLGIIGENKALACEVLSVLKYDLSLIHI